MERTNLKNTDLDISRIGMGCSQIASASKPRPEAEVAEAIHCALDVGINFFDTADSYGQGDSERRLGRALKGRRNRAIIATKAGYQFGGAGGGLLQMVKPFIKAVVGLVPFLAKQVLAARSAVARQDFSPAYVQASVDASLDRLQTDYIDLFMLHSPLPDVMADPELTATLDGLVKAGKVRFWGVSTGPAKDALPIVEDHGVAVLQMPVSFADSSACDDVLPRLSATGPGIVGREIFAKNIIETRPPALTALIEDSGLDFHQFAMKYALSQPGVDTALVGMSRAAHVQQAGELFDLPDLSDEIRSKVEAWRRHNLDLGSGGS